MKREKRQPTRAEWERIASRRPVVRRIVRPPRPKRKEAEQTRRVREALAGALFRGRRVGGGR